ncbi:MAG: pvadh [Rhodospirillales bacterium]|nr:pvadh [Rhodospirillales bacterium]
MDCDASRCQQKAALIAFLVTCFAGVAFGESNPPALLNGIGASLYAERCAQCHDHAVDRIPPRTFLSLVKTPDQVVRALTTGIMQSQAAGLSGNQINSLAAFITGKTTGATDDPDPEANRCAKPAGPIALNPSDWNGWGHDIENSRFQREAGLSAADVPRLKVKWVFAYPGHVAEGQPTVVGDRLFVGGRAGRVFALNAKTGCTYWSLMAEASVRSAISVGAMPAGSPARFAAYFSTDNGYLRAVDAETGKPIWSTRVEDYPTTRLTGSPTLYQGRLFVPLSSFEEVSAVDPKYACCTFRGGVVAVDGTTGLILWKTHTIAAEPKQFATNATGTALIGPAGAAIFSAPTIDPRRKLVYVGTGNSYTQLSVDSANAIMALDLETGARRWVAQVMAGDNICPKAQTAADCARTGPDFDFAAPPILQHQADGRDILIAISKAGTVYAFDPDRSGKILWQENLGPGSRTAGPSGLAGDDRYFYAGSADALPQPGVAVGGISGLEIATGRVLWRVPGPPPVCAWGNETNALAKAYGAVGCTSAQPGALALIPGVVFSGSADGHMRAFSTKDGAKLWDFDTAAQAYHAVNGTTATGGSIGGGVEAVANGVLYVNSGSAGVHQPGNVLIAFTVDGK